MTSSDSSWISSLLKLPSLPTAFSGLKRRNWQESGAVSCLPCQSCCWAAVPVVYASDIVPRVPSNLGAWQCWSFLIKVSDYFLSLPNPGQMFPWCRCRWLLRCAALSALVCLGVHALHSCEAVGLETSSPELLFSFSSKSAFAKALVFFQTVDPQLLIHHLVGAKCRRFPCYLQNPG